MKRHRTELVIGAAVVAALILGAALMRVAHGQTGPLIGSPRNKTFTASVQIQNGWAHARKGGAGVSTDDTTPDPNGMTWGGLPSYALPIPEQWSGLSLSFYAYGDGTGDGDPNGGTADVNVYLVDEYSSWEKVASFSIAIGELELDTLPVERTEINGGALDPNQSYKWAEGSFTDHSSGGYWSTVVNFSGTTNSIGRANFSRHEATYLIVQVDNMASMTTLYPVLTGTGP